MMVMADTSSPPSASRMMPGFAAAFLAPYGFGAVLAVATMLSMLTGVSADGHTGVCEPSLEVQISMPVDCPFNNFVDDRCMTAKMIADMTVQALFVEFDAEAAQGLLAENYIQHNPGVPTGAAPVLGFLPSLKESGLAIEVHRTLEEGNLVAYHSTYTNATLFGGDTLVGFDIFRVEDGLVQEHWDNLQELRGPTPSGHTMVDGATMIKYLKQTETTKAFGKSLVETVLVGGDGSALPNFISSTEYTQHNPDIADGLDGAAAGFAALAEMGLTLVYNSVELVVAQGNFVLVASAGEYGEGNPTAYYDFLRLEDGLFVEHWDVIQSIPPADQFAHENGKF